MDKFIFRKQVDKSILWDGTTVPNDNWNDLVKYLKVDLHKGDKIFIPTIIDNKVYESKLTWINTSGENAYRDILQIRYTPNSDLSNKLRDIFPSSTDAFINKTISRDALRKETIEFYVTDNHRLLIKCYPNSTSIDPTINEEEVVTIMDNDIIKYYLNETVKKYPLFKDYQDYHQFTLMCIRYFYYVERSIDFDQDNILTYLTDGANDGGIDAIFNDPNSDDQDIVIVQSKYYNSTELKTGNILEELYKINETLKNLQSNKISKYNQDLATAYRTATSQMDDNGEIRIAFFTAYEPKNNKEKNKLIKAATKTSGNYSIDLYFKSDIESQIELCENESSYVDIGKLSLDKANNYLEYEDSVIVNVSARSLQELQNIKRNAILGKNLRYYVKKKDVDTGISNTIQKEPENFWYKNNGIVIICEDYELDGKVLKLEKFSIINGGQTTYNIGRSDFENDFYLQCKVVKSKGNDTKAKDQFAYEIAEATNSQKPIKKADLKANSPEQIRLRDSLNKHGVYYITKKGDKVPKQYSESYQNATIEQIGKIGLSAILQMPGSGRSNLQKMYQESFYYPIFDTPANAASYADLLKITDEYKQYLKSGLSNKGFDDTDITIMKNATTFQLACITFLCKIESGAFEYSTLNKLFKDSDAIKEVLKNMDNIDCLIKHKLVNEKEVMFKIFDVIGKDVLSDCYADALERASEDDGTDGTIVPSDFLKLDSNYYRYIIKKLWSRYNRDKEFQANFQSVFK